MKIIIKTKNIKLTNEIEEFINDKIGSLAKFITILQGEKVERGKPLGEVFVEIGKETMHHKKGPFFKAEAWVRLPGRTIMAEAENEDLRSAVIEVKDEMQQEIKKYKLKKIEFNRRRQREIKNKLHSYQ